MPRGAKIDLAVTKDMRKAKQFLDRRSFMSKSGHSYLYGKDKEAARERAIDRARDPERLATVLCQNCREPLQDFFLSPNKAEMHHLKNLTADRCDCDHNLAMWCRACHSRRHNQ